ncbi:MAG: hypothetical protein M3347_11210 [Armatimonadota bacterium]|nr:hypothetical protein [Armatimonadota bacterium]
MMHTTWQQVTPLAIFLGQVVISGMAQSAPEGADLLRNMNRAERTIQYQGVLTMGHPGGPDAVAHIWRSGPKRRLEFSQPSVMKGDVLVDDGTHLWRYHHADNTAVQTKTAPRFSEADLNQRLKESEAKVAGQDTIAGRPAWIIAIYSRDEHRLRRKFWIDKETKARLRTERYGPDGRATEFSALQSVRFGPVAASRFQWVTPAGASVQQTAGTFYESPRQAQRAASWLRLPGESALPRGYEFESAIIDPGGNRGQGESWLRYTNGQNRFSIFQQNTGGSAHTEPRRVDGGWYWQHGGSRFLVVGLSEAEVTELATGLR